jgi:hypothetical protein
MRSSCSDRWRPNGMGRRRAGRRGSLHTRTSSPRRSKESQTRKWHPCPCWPTGGAATSAVRRSLDIYGGTAAASEQTGRVAATTRAGYAGAGQKSPCAVRLCHPSWTGPAAPRPPPVREILCPDHMTRPGPTVSFCRSASLNKCHLAHTPVRPANCAGCPETLECVMAHRSGTPKEPVSVLTGARQRTPAKSVTSLEVCQGQRPPPSSAMQARPTPVAPRRRLPRADTWVPRSG